MSQDTGRSAEREERKELPIERGFPLKELNELVDKEGMAQRYYRPIYTMHKWWARRLGCVFRSISLYSLLDDPEKIEFYEPGENETLSDFGGGHSDIGDLIESVDMADPESLWELYPKDVRIEDKKILDPFMGGGTSLVEASRFGADVVGGDINPVAWFITKKELEAGQTDPQTLKDAFNSLRDSVEKEVTSYYETPCPNNENHTAEVICNFWVKELDCVSCSNTVPLFKDYRIGKGRFNNKGTYNVLCPECESVVLSEDWRSETECSECSHVFIPSSGNANRGKYTCPDCGQKYSISEATGEQNGTDIRLFATEYYCESCDDLGIEREKLKGYKSVQQEDLDLFEQAREEWQENEDLHSYVPSEKIHPGAITTSSSISGNDIFQHGYNEWKDMFNERQLLCLSKILKEIDNMENQNAKEYLLLALTDALRMNSMLAVYQAANNQTNQIFRMNSFNSPTQPVEGNVWGGRYGTGTFQSIWDMVVKGVEWANAPTERHIEDGETEETKPFIQPVGENAEVNIQDVQKMDYDSEFDAVLTDPPYYDNIIYSEISDYFYVWQKILLSDEYDGFDAPHTPRSESIVVNPSEDKDDEVFESELREAFSNIYDALKEDGVLAFTYHHKGVESWGELLGALCDVGFEVTATYPVSADIRKFTKDEAVAFDIIIVARPAHEREPISWNSLRRRIYRTAQKTRKQLEENREISPGDIGVIEMGECFHEYSKHHGKVMRAGDEMTSKEVVNEIYGVIQEGSDIGEVDVFLDLLEIPDASYNDLNKLTRGTNANPEQMEDMRLYRVENGDFILGTWDDEKRMAYIQERVNGGDNNALNSLEKAQFLRYRYEQGKSTQNYLEKWDIDDELRELCEGLSDATGDDTYRRILGADSTLGDY
jgi:adenine-specific DNA methylase